MLFLSVGIVLPIFVLPEIVLPKCVAQIYEMRIALSSCKVFLIDIREHLLVPDVLRVDNQRGKNMEILQTKGECVKLNKMEERHGKDQTLKRGDRETSRAVISRLLLY